MQKFCLLTNDVETTSIVNNSLSDETGKKVLEVGMPNLIELYSKYNIKATFFFTGYMAQKFPSVVRMAFESGHEVACHGLTHEHDKAFDVLTYEEQYEHLIEAKKIIEDIIGDLIISFRAPALRVNQYTPKALIDSGFKIDSSIASQRFDMFLSFGSIKKMNRLFAQRMPYITSLNNLSEKGNEGVIEIPISSLVLPYIGTTLRAFPKTTKLLGKVLAFESKVNSKPINILVHPNEYITEERDNSVSLKRSNNFIVYLLSDFLRNRIKLKNLGTSGLKIYEEEISYFQIKGFNFITLRDYCKEIKLLKEHYDKVIRNN